MALLTCPNCDRQMTYSHFLHSHSCAPRDRGWTDNRWLYVARYQNASPAPYIKVGRALDPRRRIKELQACQPFFLELVASWPNSGHLELEVHKLLEPFRVPGPSREWYNISAENARVLIEGLLLARLTPAVETSPTRTSDQESSPD